MLPLSPSPIPRPMPRLCRFVATIALLAVAGCNSRADENAWAEQSEASNAQGRDALANEMAEVARLEEMARLGMLANATDDFGNETDPGTDPDLNALDAAAAAMAGNAAIPTPAADPLDMPAAPAASAPPPPAPPPSQDQLKSADDAVAAAMRKARER